VLTEAGHPVERLSNGRLREATGSDSIEWVLELMRAHRLPPAEVIANPNALHELFVQALAAGNPNVNGTERAPADPSNSHRHGSHA
jgi:ABC-2 type transport system ATP-binding protein